MGRRKEAFYSNRRNKMLSRYKGLRALSLSLDGIGGARNEENQTLLAQKVQNVLSKHW
jgi:hypothetical protein